ncbi:MAG: patatin-like phospholipase family protein [Thermodesulfobacteriota bacterium]
MAKLILSLDGGGIRGAATAEFLRKLEKQLAKPLHNTFDMFIGTSTGGIIAAAISSLKMAGEDLAQLYNQENGREIFPQSFWDRTLITQNQPKYDGEGKLSVLKRYFGKRLLRSSAKPLVVTAYDVERRKPKLFKSYEEDDTRVVDAVNATSAAPTYFPTVEVNGAWLIDGGVIINNPTMTGFAEAKERWPDEEIKILSVGTGTRTRPIPGEKSADYGAIGWFKHDLLGVVTDEAIVHLQAKTILADRYVRVNSELKKADDDMDNVKQGNLDNLKKLGQKWWADHGQEAISLLS